MRIDTVKKTTGRGFGKKMQESSRPKEGKKRKNLVGLRGV